MSTRTVLKSAPRSLLYGAKNVEPNTFYRNVEEGIGDEDMKEWVMSLNSAIKNPSFYHEEKIQNDFIDQQLAKPKTYNDSSRLYTRERAAAKILDLKDSIRLKKEADDLLKTGGQGSLDKATEKYTEAIDKDPNCVSLYFNRAIAHEQRGQIELAIQDINRVLKFDRNNIKALYRRAKLFNAQGNYIQAELYFKICCERQPDCIVFRETLANRREYLLKSKAFDSKVMERLKDLLPYTDTLEEAEKLAEHVKLNCPQNSMQQFVTSNFHLSKFNLKMPKNLFHVNGIAIYNVSESDKEQKRIWNMCEKFGEINAVTCPANKSSAVHVIFKSSSSPAEAIAKLNNRKVANLPSSGKIVVRFFSSSEKGCKRQMLKVCRDDGSCYYWRNGGCQNKDECSFTHLPADRNVDLLKAA